MDLSIKIYKEIKVVEFVFFVGKPIPFAQIDISDTVEKIQKHIECLEYLSIVRIEHRSRSFLEKLFNL